MAKGITLISGVIFIALTISAIVIVYEIGMPVVKRMQAAATIEKMIDSFIELDKIIRDVASEGKDSRRTVYLTIDPGEFVVNASQDAIYWDFETDAFVISPRTSRSYGNIVVGSNLETNASTGTYSGTNAYILENNHLKVYILRTGSPDSFADYNTSGLLLAVYQKDLGEWLNNTGFLDVSVDNSPDSKSGNGYTALLKSGSYLPYATVTAYMNSSYISYWINFTLESGADFLEIGASL